MAPPAPQTIKRRDKKNREASFDKLRAEALRLAQAASGDHWTDYNLHDPGVTILEQLCYALTDLMYRAEFPVADHLTNAQGQIDYQRQCLYPPQQIFPCRPTTAADYRRVLLDRVDGLDDATLSTRQRAGGPGPVIAGLHHLMLQLSDPSATGTARTIRQVQAVYLAHRNLCEDLDRSVTIVQDMPCELHATIEIAGAREAAEILAEIYERCDHHIASPAAMHSLSDLLSNQGQPRPGQPARTLEDIFTGPAMQNGFIVDEPGPDGTDTRSSVLCVGDLTAKVLAVEGVREVHRLALQCGDQPASVGSVAWRGPGWALRLRVPQDAAGLRPLRLMRRGSQVEVSAREVFARFEDRRAASRLHRSTRSEDSNGAPRDIAAALTLPEGEHRRLDHYHSVQYQFPAVYGLGDHGVPAGAPPQQKAQVMQLKAYLLIFEQVLAHSLAQLQHMRELFSLQGTLGPTYWWQMLDQYSVPGIGPLYREPPAQVVTQVFARFDNAIDRKSRVFDHLLALYGETWLQHSMRQFCAYHSPAELELLLLENKAAYLGEVVLLGRDRAAGFDYSKPSWNEPRNCSGLLRRVALLLGFRHAFSRPLTAALSQQRRELRPAHRRGERGGPADDSGLWLVEPPADDVPMDAVGEPAPRASSEALREHMQADLKHIPPLRGHALSEAMLRAGLQRERYHTTPDTTPDTTPHAKSASTPGSSGAGPQRLLLGPDELGQWWHLGSWPTQAAAWRAADSLRRFLLHLTQESEGLHVVEHVLLRPVGQSGPHAGVAVPEGFYGLRFSVLFPAWPLRCHQPNFRRLAEETVQINAPSHLAGRCHWLGFAAMQQFEAHFEEWLAARLAFAHEPGAEPVARVNRAACRVIESLLAYEQAHEGADGQATAPAADGR